MSNLSFVIPVLNEEDSLPELYRQVCAMCEQNAYSFEIILIDDGSTDGSWDVMRSMSEEDDRVQCLRFRRNFGKAAGLRAGANLASNEFVVTMDADLQDDPAEVPRMLEKLDEGFDLISGWKQVRNDPLGKTLPSKAFNWLVGG